jgi:membrane peptidoglycan carboxypeptidase
MLEKILRHIAIRIYNQEYILLHDRLLMEYELIKHNNTNNIKLISNILISGEDHRFYYHIGFDIISIIRAIFKRLFFNKIEGASTIEQQLVRVITNDFEITYRRKIKEIFLATTIASIVPKFEIPKIYLNVAYYGTGMNGLRQAYGKLGIIDQETISIEQAAEIVSMIKYPLPAKPSIKRLEQIKSRREYLIKLYKKHLDKKYFKIYW